MYDPDWVNDQLSHDESVGKYSWWLGLNNWSHWLTNAVSDWKEPKFATIFCNSEKSWKIWGMWKCEISNRSMLFSLYKIIDLLHYLLPLLWKHTCLVFLHSNTVVAFVIKPICGYFLYWFFPAIPMQLTDI